MLSEGSGPGIGVRKCCGFGQLRKDGEATLCMRPFLPPVNWRCFRKILTLECSTQLFREARTRWVTNSVCRASSLRKNTCTLRIRAKAKTMFPCSTLTATEP